MLALSPCFYHFSERIGSYEFDADLLHCIGLHNHGGLAYLGQLCADAPFRSGTSGLDRAYDGVPVSQWNIKVIAHEMGHNLNSSHTHD